MKISEAALPLLILAAALGALAFESSAHELGSAYPWPVWVASDVQQGGVHRPGDCCFSYTRRTIRCVFMEDYFETGGGCSLPAVIFTTKRGQKVCADPHNQRVQFCMKIVDSAKQRRKRLVEKGY